MNKQRVNLIAVIIIMLANAYVCLNNSQQVETAQDRPFVYRQLVPVLVRFLILFHIPPIAALIIVVTLAGVGYYLALRKLANVFYVIDDKREWIFLGLFLFTLAVIFNSQRDYDTMTLLLFTLAYYCLATGYLDWYPVIFILACLNRETAFLLILSSIVVYKYYDQQAITPFVIVWQVLAFGLIQFSLHLLFSNNPGSVIFFRPLENLRFFLAHPFYLTLHIIVTVLCLYLIFHNWQHKPRFLRLMFVAICPVLVLLYFVVGWAFEMRVFAEIYPIAAILFMPVYGTRV